MSDLISRDDFINSIVCSVSSPCETKQEQRDAQFKQKYTVDAFIKELKRAPTVDAVEVVHGYLTHGYYGEYDNFDYCSACGARNLEDSEYCCQCGAKMDGHKKDVM